MLINIVYVFIASSTRKSDPRFRGMGKEKKKTKKKTNSEKI